MKLQSLRLHINSKTIGLQRVKTVIVFLKMVLLCSSEFPYRRPRPSPFLMTKCGACDTFVSYFCEPDHMVVNVRVSVCLRQMLPAFTICVLRTNTSYSARISLTCTHHRLTTSKWDCSARRPNDATCAVECACSGGCS